MPAKIAAWCVSCRTSGAPRWPRRFKNMKLTRVLGSAPGLARPSHNYDSQPSHWGAVMTRTLRAVILAVLLTAFAAPNAGATSRIKDLANIEGVRQNQLIGYGLVVGLNGTGDTLSLIH